MKTLVRVALIALGFVVAGCSREPVARLMAADDAVTAAEQVISGSVEGRYDLVAARVAPEGRAILSPRFQYLLRGVFSSTQGEPEVAAWSTQSFLGNSDAIAPWSINQRPGMGAHITLRYLRGNGDAVHAKFELVKRHGFYYVTKIDYWTLPGAAVGENDFNTSTKPAKQTLVLFSVLAMLCFVLGTSAACLMNRTLPHKPAWLALIWVGFIQATLNWSTGEFTLSPFLISLPPVWITQQNAWEPLLVQFFLPVGAIWYWIARARQTPLPVCKMPEKQG